jgi:Uri superfamily endonuclease
MKKATVMNNFDKNALRLKAVAVRKRGETLSAEKIVAEMKTVRGFGASEASTLRMLKSVG